MSVVEKSILISLQKNGFPQKKVSLPFQPIFQSCKNHGVSLSKALRNLEAQGVLNEMKDDRIIFHSKEHVGNNAEQAPNDIPDHLLKEAEERLKQMDPVEVEKMKQRLMEMSPEERENLMKEVKDLFGGRK